MIHTVLLTFLLPCGWLAEPDAAAEAKKTKAWLEVCTAYAQGYEISPAKGPQQTFKMLPNPVLSHAQATRGSVDIGAVWLWVGEDGRPGAIGTVFVYPLYGTPYHNMVHEFHSLADGPLRVVWRNRKTWQPSKAGLQWKALPDAPPPAESATSRRRQLRELSRRFKAHRVGRGGDRWELRLLSRPLYSYDPKDHAGTSGGALFAFCQGTDPEIILAIEARPAGDAFRWHYACAGFSDLVLHVRLGDREVWSQSVGVASPGNVHWGRGFPRLELPKQDREEVRPEPGRHTTRTGEQP